MWLLILVWFGWFVVRIVISQGGDNLYIRWEGHVNWQHCLANG